MPRPPAAKATGNWKQGAQLSEAGGLALLSCGRCSRLNIAGGGAGPDIAPAPPRRFSAACNAIRSIAGAGMAGTGRRRKRANCETVSKAASARPGLAWPRSQPDPPSQIDEDGKESGRAHGPAGRKRVHALAGPAAALLLRELHIHGEMDAAFRRNKAALAELCIPDEQAILRRVGRREASRCLRGLMTRQGADDFHRRVGAALDLSTTRSYIANVIFHFLLPSPASAFAAGGVHDAIVASQDLFRPRQRLPLRRMEPRLPGGERDESPHVSSQGAFSMNFAALRKFMAGLPQVSLRRIRSRRGVGIPKCSGTD